MTSPDDGAKGAEPVVPQTDHSEATSAKRPRVQPPAVELAAAEPSPEQPSTPPPPGGQPSATTRAASTPRVPQPFERRDELPLIGCLVVCLLATIAIYALQGTTSDLVAGVICSVVAAFGLLRGQRAKTYRYELLRDSEGYRKAAQNLGIPAAKEKDVPLDVSKTPVGVHIDLLKLEYQRGIDRYDNLYKSIWLQFSYMAVLSAGIATFSSKVMNVWVVAVFALCPLVFWFFASFLPMDFYGVEARRRLGTIETALTELSFQLQGWNTPAKVGDAECFSLRHFTEFKEIQYRWHVGQAVRFAFVLITVAFVWTGTRAGAYLLQKYGSAPAISTQAAQVDSISFVVRLPQTKTLAESLAVMSATVDSVRESQRRTQATLDSIRARLPKP